MPIEEIGCVVVMGTMLATIAVLRAVVAILQPTCLMHRMFAFDDNQVARFERCLAEIAGLLNGSVPEAHILTCVANDIFALEKQIFDSRYNKLHDEIDKKHQEESEENAFQYDKTDGVSVHNDGVERLSQGYCCGCCGDERVVLVVVEV